MNGNTCYRYGEMLRDYVKDYDESKKYFLKALEIDTNKYGINGSYGYLLYLRSDYDQRIKYVEKELEIDDDNNWAHFYYGLLYKDC